DHGRVEQPGGVVVSLTSTDTTFGGNDVITAGTGNDTALGGPGSDQIDGGDGDDVLLGDNGSVTIAGGFIPDRPTIAAPTPGNDTITAGNGNEPVMGGAGTDSITGAAGTDIILNDNGQLTLSGGLVTVIATTDPGIGGDDVITGDDDVDIALGGFGNDLMTGN